MARPSIRWAAIAAVALWTGAAAGGDMGSPGIPGWFDADTGIFTPDAGAGGRPSPAEAPAADTTGIIVIPSVSLRPDPLQSLSINCYGTIQVRLRDGSTRTYPLPLLSFKSDDEGVPTWQRELNTSGADPKNSIRYTLTCSVEDFVRRERTISGYRNLDDFKIDVPMIL